MKEKLVELMIEAEKEWFVPMWVPPSERLRCLLIQIADCLLANGVTFATDTNDGCKWIPASKPPEGWQTENGGLTNFLIFMPEYGVDVGEYFEPAKRWLCLGFPCNVTHWMPLPEPPKEE